MVQEGLGRIEWDVSRWGEGEYQANWTVDWAQEWVGSAPTLRLDPSSLVLY